MSGDLPADRNRLGAETSPYLRQHKDNPVHWHPWGDAAFAAAKDQDKPILLSVGYAACHWCHVMAHESFEDDGVAALMNRGFINIKVDREERPDVDVIYQKALALMGEQGGWPLTMFLLPDGRPFWGGTYFPPSPAYGRPSFAQVLTHIGNLWRERRDEVVGQSNQLLALISEHPVERLRDGLSLALLDTAAARLLDYIDFAQGGMNGAPKFPMPFVFEFLWRAYLRTKDPRFRDAVATTLTQIAQGGIYDHVGGGFARYSTDAAWLVPHFEKMLYDNAQLIDLMTLVFQDTRSELFAARVRETIAWLNREMTGENGAFAASLDADSEGVEGKFYVWTEAEIDRALGADAGLFKQVYDVSPAGNWEGHTILNRTASRDRTLTPDEETRLAAAREVLLSVRAPRVRPGRDDKVLADWNGLTIAALARAGAAFGEAAWIDRAAEVFDAVETTMTWMDDEGRRRIGHSLCGGRLQQTAMLDDYANMVNAALALHAVRGESRYLARAEAWTDVANQLYWDDAGGYFLTASDATGLIVRSKSASDSAVPSGNGGMVFALARLFYLTGKQDYRARAMAAVAALEVETMKSFPHGVTLLNAYEFLETALQVVVIADRREGAVFDAVLAQRSLPNLVLTRIGDAADLPEGHPAKGKTRLNGAATAYICKGPVCGPPQTTADGFRRSLSA